MGCPPVPKRSEENISFLGASPLAALLSFVTLVAAQGSAPIIDVSHAQITDFQNTTSEPNQYYGIYYTQASIGDSAGGLMGP